MSPRTNSWRNGVTVAAASGPVHGVGGVPWVRSGSVRPKPVTSSREGTEVGAAHAGILEEDGGAPLARHAAGLEEVRPVREGQRRLDILLHEEDRHAAPIDLAQDVEDGLDEARREAERRLVGDPRSEEHTPELQSQAQLVCRLLLL